MIGCAAIPWSVPERFVGARAFLGFLALFPTLRTIELLRDRREHPAIVRIAHSFVPLDLAETRRAAPRLDRTLVLALAQRHARALRGRAVVDERRLGDPFQRAKRRAGATATAGAMASAMASAILRTTREPEEEPRGRGRRDGMLRRCRFLCLVSGLALLAGCAGSASSSRSGSAPPSTSSTRCDELLERYRAVLAAGTGSCRSDEDCVVYGGVDPQAVCGGTTDTETGRALTRIASERDAAGCPRPGYSCPAIEARCADGVCR